MIAINGGIPTKVRSDVSDGVGPAHQGPRERLASYRVDSSSTDQSVVIALMALLSFADWTLRA
jgi:hypothetical protein